MSQNASILAFIAVAVVLVLTPGVGTTYLLSTIVAHGRRAGYLTALGMIIGASMHATIAAGGIAILHQRFPAAVTWIALVGGTFIVLLGARGIILAIRCSPEPLSTPNAQRPTHGIVLTGMLISLSNAPLPLFYLVVVPQYIPRGMSRVEGVALLSAIHLSLSFTWMVTFVTLVGQVVEVLRRPRVRLALQLTTGLVLVALGARAVAGAS